MQVICASTMQRLADSTAAHGKSRPGAFFAETKTYTAISFYNYIIDFNLIYNII